LDNIQEKLDSKVKKATKEERKKFAKRLIGIRERLKEIKFTENRLQERE